MCTSPLYFVNPAKPLIKKSVFCKYATMNVVDEVFKGTNVLTSDFQVYHVNCNFIIGYICRITVNLGTLKDGTFLTNIFASNNRFSDRNVFQNGVVALSKIDDALFTKS